MSSADGLFKMNDKELMTHVASQFGPSNSSRVLQTHLKKRTAVCQIVGRAPYTTRRGPLRDPQDMLTLRTWTGILLCATLIGACAGCASSSTSASGALRRSSSRTKISTIRGDSIIRVTITHSRATCRSHGRTASA